MKVSICALLSMRSVSARSIRSHSISVVPVVGKKQNFSKSFENLAYPSASLWKLHKIWSFKMKKIKRLSSSTSGHWALLQRGMIDRWGLTASGAKDLRLSKFLGGIKEGRPLSMQMTSLTIHILGEADCWCPCYLVPCLNRQSEHFTNARLCRKVGLCTRIKRPGQCHHKIPFDRSCHSIVYHRD